MFRTEKAYRLQDHDLTVSTILCVIEETREAYCSCRIAR